MPKLGESWYIFDDATGECTIVEINDITTNTIELLYKETGVMKRFYTEYVNFADKVKERILN